MVDADRCVTQCDETKPTCSRCIGRQQPCEYNSDTIQQPQVLSVGSAQSQEDPSISTTSNAPISNPSSSGSLLGRSPSYGIDPAPEQSPSSSVRSESDIDDVQADLYLIDQFLNPDLRNLGPAPQIAHAQRLALVTLAASNRGAMHAVLALGAALVCVQVLLKHESAERSVDVHELLRKSYRNHHTALLAVQCHVSTNTPKSLEMAHSVTAILFSYTLARRRIYRLLGRLHPSPFANVQPEEDSPTNLEWIVLLRGINTLGIACQEDQSCSQDHLNASALDREPMDPSISSYIMRAIDRTKMKSLCLTELQQPCKPGHALMPVISATRTVALNTLQDKADDLHRRLRQSLRDQLGNMAHEDAAFQLSKSASFSACSLALDVLVSVGNATFKPSDPQAYTHEDISFNGTGMGWLLATLKSGPAYNAACPLTAVTFSWMKRVPDDYVGILRTPLRPRKEVDEPLSIDYEIQLLAWAIYAHWLVFVILVEDENWWIGDLAISDIGKLQKMLMAGRPDGEVQEWWPSTMCSIAEQLRNYIPP